MSFFGKVDKSTTGAVIKKVARHTRPSKSIDSSPFTPGQGQQDLRRHISTKTAPAPAALSFADWFIGALVSAGHCDKHTPLPRAPPYSSRRLRQLQSPQSRVVVSHSFFTARRSQHTTSCRAEPTNSLDQAQLHGLVDQYDTPYNAAEFERQVYEISPGPQLVVSEKPEDVAWPPKEAQWSTTEAVAATLDRLLKALRDRRKDPEEIYNIYRELPSPRAPYLPAKIRHRLFRHLGLVKRKNAAHMLRYLSVVDDVKAQSIPLLTSEWNTAMSFATNYTNYISGSEIESALQIFREMEAATHVKADTATFNILFDAATKAGKHSLAEMIHKEMESRGIKYNRFHHVSLIFYFGLKEDGEGVRKAYKAMVDSGEIIDTVALNAVMAALIRAREPQAAMLVYRRMCTAYETEGMAPPPVMDWRKKRRIERSLISLANIHRRFPDIAEKDKANRTVSPDAHTYSILVNYHAVQAGHLHTATKLLDEMAWFRLPMQGDIFVSLFKGFTRHGAELYSSWTAARLESVWKAFKDARVKDENAVEKQADIYLGKWIVVWVLQAFAKCAGRERAQQVWEEIEHLPDWKPTDEEKEHVRTVLHDITERWNGL